MRGLRSVTRRLRIGPLSLLAVPLVKRRGVPAKVGVQARSPPPFALRAESGSLGVVSLGAWLSATIAVPSHTRLGLTLLLHSASR